MAEARIYPHPVPPDGTVEFGDWWLIRNGERIVLTRELKDWDYASTEVVGTSITINADGVVGRGPNVPQDAVALIVADCPSAQARFVSRTALDHAKSGEPIPLELELPRGQLAKEVVLRAYVVSGDSRDPSAPRPASRLAESKPHRVALEGDASRFPVEAFSFQDNDGPDIPWRLSVSFDAPSDAFLGAIRLFVNTDHPAGRALIEENPERPADGLAKEYLVRQLVAALASEGFGDDVREGEYEDGSVAEVCDRMCQLFLSLSLEEAVQMYREQPADFDAFLQKSLEPLQEVFK